MSLTEALSMEPVKSKLRDLETHMPGQERVIYEFGAYLGERLSEELVPEGFYMTAQLVLHDLKKGVSGLPEKPIPNHLAGYPPFLYTVLSLSIVQIAEAVCPPEFAKGVKTMDEAVYAELKKK